MSRNQSKKVVLFFPNPVRENRQAPAADSPGFPMAILALAGPLKAAGYEPALIYEGVEDDLKSRIAVACNGAICLGVSAMTGNQLRGAIDYSKLAKELYPELPIVWGGYHPTLLPEQTLAEDYVDIVVRGQGEATFMELVRCLETGGSLGGVAGISYKEDGRQVANQPKRPEPLESLPPYPYELLDVEKIINRNSASFRSLQYLSSSG
ncbi:MAG: cobalamin-dependent protein, partial [Actinomycetota bacterium]